MRSKIEISSSVKAPECQKWSVDVIDVPADGSCFFHCIARAFQSFRNQFESKFKKMIDNYMVGHLYALNCITADEIDVKVCDDYAIDSDLIRYICAIKVTQDDLELYNSILAADNQETIKSQQELVESIMLDDRFADCIEIKILSTIAFENQFGIYILDGTVADGVVFMPPEWTNDKNYNVILVRHHEHYSLLEIIKNNTRMGKIVSSKVANEFIEEYIPGKY